MNEQQKTYALAKANYETACQIMQEHETNWMKEHGRTERFIFTVNDEDDFDRLNADYDEDETALRLFAAYNDAIDLLHKAENELIEYGLSVIPAALVDTIRKGIERYKFRERFIDIIFKLDTHYGKNEVKRQLETLYKMACGGNGDEHLHTRGYRGRISQDHLDA